MQALQYDGKFNRIDFKNDDTAAGLSPCSVAALAFCGTHDHQPCP
ncbi:hypothetical protein [Rhizobium sp. YTUHZ045]